MDLEKPVMRFPWKILPFALILDAALAWGVAWVITYARAIR